MKGKETEREKEKEGKREGKRLRERENEAVLISLTGMNTWVKNLHCFGVYSDRAS